MNVERIAFAEVSETRLKLGALCILPAGLVGEGAIKGNAVKLALCVLVE
jgi:hypothetical protein